MAGTKTRPRATVRGTEARAAMAGIARRAVMDGTVTVMTVGITITPLIGDAITEIGQTTVIAMATMVYGKAEVLCIFLQIIFSEHIRNINAFFALFACIF